MQIADGLDDVAPVAAGVRERQGSFEDRYGFRMLVDIHQRSRTVELGFDLRWQRRFYRWRCRWG